MINDDSGGSQKLSPPDEGRRATASLLSHQHSLYPTLVQLRHFGTLFPRRFFLEVPCKGRECFERKEVCRCKSGSRVVAETEVEVDGSDEVTNKSRNSRLSAVPGYACLVDLTNTVVSERWHYQT